MLLSCCAVASAKAGTRELTAWCQEARGLLLSGFRGDWDGRAGGERIFVDVYRQYCRLVGAEVGTWEGRCREMERDSFHNTGNTGSPSSVLSQPVGRESCRG